MTIFELTKSFPNSERFSLTDQVRRSSRSVSANIAEAWEKRRYEAAFISKLIDSASEAAETQTWLDYASACGYVRPEICQELSLAYEELLRSLHGMIKHSEKWCSLRS